MSVKSTVIEQYIANIDAGLIVGKENSSGPALLKRLRGDLQAILGGTDPDTALGINRRPGVNKDPHSIALAVAIAKLRRQGEKWAVVETQINGYLSSIGKPKLSTSRIKGLPNDFAEEIKVRLAIADMLQAINSQ